MAEQRARDEVGVTEDDVMEIRQDISTLRYELIDILHNNGMKTPRVNQQDATGKKLLRCEWKSSAFETNKSFHSVE